MLGAHRKAAAPIREVCKPVVEDQTHCTGVLHQTVSPCSAMPKGKQCKPDDRVHANAVRKQRDPDVYNDQRHRRRDKREDQRSNKTSDDDAERDRPLSKRSRPQNQNESKRHRGGPPSGSAGSP